MPYNAKAAYRASVRDRLAQGFTNNAEGVWVSDHKGREGGPKQPLPSRLAANTARNKKRKSRKNWGPDGKIILAWGHVRPHPEWRAA